MNKIHKETSSLSYVVVLVAFPLPRATASTTAIRSHTASLASGLQDLMCEPPPLPLEAPYGFKSVISVRIAS